MTITFTPLTDFHLPLLLEWLKEPHVKAWWDPNVEWTLRRAQEKYRSYIQGYKLENGIKKSIQAYIFYIDKQLVGYIQLGSVN
jgi:aminoglycoside 6'-N-acetyltransferase